MEKHNSQKRRRHRSKKNKIRRIARLILVVLILALIGLVTLIVTKDRSMEKGTKALEEGNYTEAIAQFEVAISKDNQIEEAYRGEGIAYFEQKEYEQAQKAFEEAISHGADTTGTIYNFLGICQMKQENYKDAITQFGNGISAGGSSDLQKEMRHNVIACYEELRDWENAKAQAAEYVKMFPDDEEMARENEFLQSR